MVISICSSFYAKLHYLSQCIKSLFEGVGITKYFLCATQNKKGLRNTHHFWNAVSDHGSWLSMSLFLCENHYYVFPTRHEMNSLSKFSLCLFYMFFTMHLSLQEKKKKQTNKQCSTIKIPWIFQIRITDLRKYHKFSSLLPPSHIFL